MPLIAVSEATGVSFISPATADVVASVGFDAPARGMAKVTGIDKPTLYVALGDDRLGLIQLGEADGKTRPRLDTTVAMPGDVRRVIFDEPTGMVHVLGSAPDGSADTIYVIEPHGNAVFADARLPFGAAAWAHRRERRPPQRATGSRSSSRRPAGQLATVDIGNHAFAWRLPGVLAGALMAALIYLLAGSSSADARSRSSPRILVLVDGMLFARAGSG